MTESISKHERNLSAVIHASTLSRFFIPFGNFLLPLVFWMANRKELGFVDYNGKQALNFQISMLLYSIILVAFSLPFLLGFLPVLLDGGIFSWDEFHDTFNGSLRFNGDIFSMGRYLWPVGIAGLGQVVLFLINIIYTILATLRTNEGQYFRYPITIKFIK